MLIEYSISYRKRFLFAEKDSNLSESSINFEWKLNLRIQEYRNLYHFPNNNANNKYTKSRYLDRKYILFLKLYWKTFPKAQDSLKDSILDHKDHGATEVTNQNNSNPNPFEWYKSISSFSKGGLGLAWCCFDLLLRWHHGLYDLI